MLELEDSAPGEAMPPMPSRFKAGTGGGGGGGGRRGNTPSPEDPGAPSLTTPSPPKPVEEEVEEEEEVAEEEEAEDPGAYPTTGMERREAAAMAFQAGGKAEPGR